MRVPLAIRCAQVTEQSRCVQRCPKDSDGEMSCDLSEQLSESNGVICPPAGVDPGISVPPVGGGRMPVIPPPGTPGGDPNVVPKTN
jgi:hypothetical protein